MVSRPRGLVSGLVATVLGVVILGATVPAHADPRDDAAADAAVTWMSSQPVTGTSLEQRLDLALAYLVAGAPKDRIDPLVADAEFLLADGTDVSARTLAQAVVVLDLAGRPTSLAGGRDLVGELTASIGAAPAEPGELLAEPGESVATQAWGVIALLRLGATATDETAFLTSRQCPDGSFVADPVMGGCGAQPDLVDQALTLTALVSASDQGVAVGDAPARLLAWLERQARPGQPVVWPQVPASALAWLVWPLEELGRTDLAEAARQQLRSLQLGPAVALDVDHVGAMGGETSVLVQDLLTQRLDPGLDLTARAVLGWRPGDLVRRGYAPRAALAGLPAPGPSLVGPSEADPDTTVQVLAQGYVPGETITMTIRGLQGVVTEAKTDQDGVALLSFTPQALATPGQELVVTDSSGATQSLTLNVVAGLADEIDATTGRSRADDEPLELSRGQGALAAGGLVLLLALGALVLREPS